MKAILNAALAATLLAFSAGAAVAQGIDAPQLKGMVQGMGYTVEDISDPGEPLKFEFTLVTENFNIPISLEVSPSGRYIWATCNLGEKDIDEEAALGLLHANSEIQPTSFWISNSGRLMIGFPIDNRDVTPAHLKFVFDKLTSDVDGTADIWNY